MRYIQPAITGILAATSTIQGEKSGVPTEIDLDRSQVAAYEADE